MSLGSHEPKRLVIASSLAGLIGVADLISSRGASAEPLDLSGYVETFVEEFKAFDISAYGPGTRWIAHTPWNGDFGDATFGNPGPFGPFSITDKGLRISATKTPDGKWYSGLICSMDRDGPGQQGFAQKFGYFEMRAKLPDGAGTWPAFWLVGIDKSVASSEIDILEYYGHDPRYFHAVQHIWVNGKDQYAKDKMMEVQPHLLTNNYNTFGVLISPDQIRFYLNRNEFWEAPTPAEYKQPMYILTNLALGGGWPIKDLKSPAVMDIEYIRVFQSRSLLEQGGGGAKP